MNNITIIGEGAWGTAIAQVLADNNHQVNLWCYDPIVAEQINTTHINSRYMPGFVLSKNITACVKLKDILAGSSFVFISTPTIFFRSIITQCKAYYSKEQCWVILSKGIENSTLLLPGQILADVLDAHVNYVVLSGPSFAQEVMTRQLTGVMVAAHDKKQAQQVVCLVQNSYFYSYIHGDVIGVQLGGALKNVLALLMGIAHGAHWSENARAFLFTHGWQELLCIARTLGACEPTMLGLAGLGDTFLTVTGEYSRNRALGVAIGQGNKGIYQQRAMCAVPEGINTIRSVMLLCQKHKLLLPIFQSLSAIIFDSAPITQLLQAVVLSAADQEK